MKVNYDDYYLKEHLFGKAYPELISYFSKLTKKGKVLDLGCGQGRDALALARIGFKVLGIDHSKVGIDQLNQMAQKENLPLEGRVADIYSYSAINGFNFIILDSMFHFQKNDREKEEGFIRTIMNGMDAGASIVFCIQDSGKKIAILQEIIDSEEGIDTIRDQKFDYSFVDNESGHHSITKYKMIIAKKQTE